MAQLSNGCEKGWHYMSPPAGSGGGNPDGAGAGGAGGGVLLTFV